MVELRFETGLFNLRRRVVAVDRGKLLPLLSQYAMPVQIAVQAEITENVESIIDVLKRPARLVAAVAAFGKIFDQNLAALLRVIGTTICRSCSKGWRTWG